MRAYALWFVLSTVHVAAGSAQPLKSNPTPKDYVERNGGGSSVVPAGQLTLDGHAMRCGSWATVLDPNLNDYAASYPQFVILNPTLISKVKTPVKFWICSHECGHLFGERDESKADCFGVRRGRAAGWLTKQGLDQVCTFINAGRADAMHLGGPDRCARMRECYGRGSADRSR